jgi:endonuclease/exonuclease/phosphatase family metal-dependent hydrolase
MSELHNALAEESVMESDGHWIKVMSYNIQIGISTGHYRHYVTNSWKHVLPYRKRAINLQSIGDFISDYDLVGLQEVDAGSLRTGFVNQTQFLASAAEFPYWHQKTNRNLGKFAQHSMGMLSRFPSTLSRHHRLPSRIPGRGALEVHLGHGENPLVVILLHLSLGKKARMEQLEYISGVVSSHKHVIVMGDMNCPPDSPELRYLVEKTGMCEPLHYEHTYPSWNPRSSFDHIFVTPSLEVRKIKVYRRFFSDHLPVCAQIRIPDDVGLL